MVAAPSSGSGKTVVTCALLRALARRGIACAAFKCGPDYIDPLFHRRVVEAHNPLEHRDIRARGAACEQGAQRRGVGEEAV